MQDKTKINLVATEIAGLWNTYVGDSMAICMLKHFLNTVKDEEIRPLLMDALNISHGHIQIITEKFNQEGLPIPQGFNENDVNMQAPSLYTDPYYLNYLAKMSMFGMYSYATILSHIARIDIRDFFTKCLTESADLYNKTADTLQALGLFIKAPRVEFTQEIDFVDKQNFFSSGLLSKRRTLLAREISQIFSSLRYNQLGGALITGFAQVAKSKKLRDYFFRGRDLAAKKTETLVGMLLDENIPIPSTSESFVTSSTIAPFSDKLMLFVIVFLNGAKIGQDGLALGNIYRHDLQAYFAGSIAEVSKYTEDGLDIMIQNKWLEQPPQAIEHRELVHA